MHQEVNSLKFSIFKGQESMFAKFFSNNFRQFIAALCLFQVLAKKQLTEGLFAFAGCFLVKVSVLLRFDL